LRRGSSIQSTSRSVGGNSPPEEWLGRGEEAPNGKEVFLSDVRGIYSQKNTAARASRSGVVVSEGWGLIDKKLRHAQIGIPTRRDGISSIEDGFLLLL